MTENKKRVLFISPQPFFQWRGSPIRVAFDVQALTELGYEVDLLTLPIGEDRAIPGVRVLRVGNPLGVKNIPIGPSPWKLLFDALLFLQAFRLVRKHAYHALHVIEDAGIIGVLLKRWARAALVFEKHSDPGSYKKGFLRNLVMSLYGRVEALTIRRADATIGTGPGLVQQAKTIAPNRPAHHIFDIPSSLAESNPDRANVVREELQRQPEDVLITYVGSFAVYQGIDLMFQSIPHVVREHPAARFVIIGGTADQVRERRQGLEAEGVSDSVLFAGKVDPDDLPNYLSASDILLSPRIAGSNTPLKLLDYMKVGRAIAATDTEANRLILNESNAALAPPEPAAYAGAIGQLVSDRTRRETLGRAGLDLIRTRYNFAEFKERLRRCYEQLP